MIPFLLRRLWQSLILLTIVSMIGFAILYLAPGGPMSQFAQSAQMSQEDLDRIARQLGLDRPFGEALDFAEVRQFRPAAANAVRWS